MTKHFFLAALFGLAALCALPSQAQAPAGGDIEFRNFAETEVEVKKPDGKLEKKRSPVEKAIPGTEIHYTSLYRNVGTRPASNIAVVNPVPANTTLVGGSAWGDSAEVVFSADGGKSWARADQVRVTGADGKQRPAGISEFTHIRWTYRGELPPGKEAAVGFRVTVN
jgi:uncharacterized repeat protein (TIGR01451 family)